MYHNLAKVNKILREMLHIIAQVEWQYLVTLF